ncbi:MAG: YihY/virulence factor BrkB family protein [Austwickia sp.]|nr:YihY/virulence factor BrkB family protein [Actinomycetota bacterium]MCO5311118.1 YihY/virulence factor BrkB family protein [Austwickia sp.]
MEDGGSSGIARVDDFQRRHRFLGLPIALIYKYVDDQGAYLAALITYYGFISLFPLLLLLSSVLGFVLENNPELQARIMESAFRQIPVIGDQVQRAQLRGSGIAVVIGAVGALYGAVGVAQAMQNALNAAWYVPRNSRPNPVLARARSLTLLGLVALFLLVTTFLSQWDAALRALTDNEQAVGYWTTFASMAVTWVLFQVISRFGTTYRVTIRQALPGSILGVLVWQGLQTAGTGFVARVIAGSSDTNGVFAVVLGLLAWIYLASVSFVVCTELNVVLALKLYPRALLTPMTDDVDLTEGDRAAYAGLARAQRLKGFQKVQVSFEYDGQFRTGRAAREQAEREEAQARAETERRAEQARRARRGRRQDRKPGPGPGPGQGR